MKSNKKQNASIKYGILVVLCVIMLFAVAYAAFIYFGEGKSENKVTTGTFKLVLDESATEGITLSTAVPVSDSDGLGTTPYIFTVENTGTIRANYRLSIINDDDKYVEHGCSEKKMVWSNIKYSITKNGGTATTQLLSQTTDGQLDIGLMAPTEKNSYTFRIWISDTAGNDVMGTHFHGKIKVQAIQEGQTNYDTGE